jgi:hypothetical protein
VKQAQSWRFLIARITPEQREYLARMEHIGSIQLDDERKYNARAVRKFTGVGDYSSRTFYADRLTICQHVIRSEAAMGAAEARAHSRAQLVYESPEDYC